MDSTANDWLHLALRWLHVVAAIMWIGSSLFFMWLDSHLEKPRVAKEGLEGELWMVHSGGFYEVQKKFVSPEELPKTLHWFKWEAAFTWISGLSLLVVLYWSGGLMVDPSVANISNGAAIGIVVGTFLVSFAIYDLTWNSALGKGSSIGAMVVTAALVVGAAMLFHKTLAPRAAYIHVGGMVGTWMVANVWMRIIPAQRAMVEAAKAGKKPDPTPGYRAKQRSRQNSYFTYPVLFTMLTASHFAVTTYATKYNWLILFLLFAIGMAVRHYQIVKEGSPKILFAALVLVFGAAHMYSAMVRKKPPTAGDVTAPGIVVASTAAAGGPTSVPSVIQVPDGGHALTADDLGAVSGSILLDGAPPAPQEIKVASECGASGPVYDGKIVSKDGKLANVFVWLKGVSWNEPPPTTEVIINQHTCLYEPRVLGVQAGQPLVFVNGDEVLHNVHAEGDQGFNFGLTGKLAPRVTRKLEETDSPIHIKCDVHPWMSAWVHVMSHPYFAVTGIDGSFTLQKVPPGTYALAAWHEVYGTKEQNVTITAKGSANVSLTFTATN